MKHRAKLKRTHSKTLNFMTHDSDTPFERFNTDIISEQDLEGLIMAMQTLEDYDFGEEGKATTIPAPSSITEFHAKATALLDAEDKDEKAGDSDTRTQLEENLDLLMRSNASSQELYEAVSSDLKKLGSFEEQEMAWNSIIYKIQKTIIETFGMLQGRIGDKFSPVEITGHFRKCWQRVISPSLRRCILQEIRRLIGKIDRQDQKQFIVQAFALSIIQTLDTDDEGNDIVIPSPDVINVFRGQKIPEPKSESIKLAAFSYSYPNSTLKLYQFFLSMSEHDESAAKAFALLKQTQNLGVASQSCKNMDMDTFAQLCKTYFDEMSGTLRSARDPRIKVGILMMWNEIIAPQLIIFGELLFSQTFLIPNVST